MRRSRSLVTLALTALVVGCASASERSHASDPAASGTAAGTQDPPIVIVGPVNIPQLVDRPQLVMRDTGFGVRILERERWATPLKESLPRVIAGDLARACVPVQ